MARVELQGLLRISLDPALAEADPAIESRLNQHKVKDLEDVAVLGRYTVAAKHNSGTPKSQAHPLFLGRLATKER